MERKIVALIAVSMLVVGILLWSKRDAERPPPAYEPTIQIRAACAAQQEIWCGVTLPDGATPGQRRECVLEYFPRCMGCLSAVDHGWRKGRRGVPGDSCLALKRWKRNHPPAPQGETAAAAENPAVAPARRR